MWEWVGETATTLMGAIDWSEVNKPTPDSGATRASGGNTAIWGLLGVLVGAVLAALGNYLIARSTRRNTNQLAALYDHQVESRALRSKYRAWGQEMTHSTASTLELDERVEAAQIASDRIRKDEVRTLFQAWSDIAQFFWDGDPAYSASDENTAWDALRAQWTEQIRKYG